MEVELECKDNTVSLDIELEWPKDEGTIEDGAVTAKATFEVYEDSTDDHRWRLIHNSGNITTDSGKGYFSEQNATQGLHGVQKNAPSAPVEDAE